MAQKRWKLMMSIAISSIIIAAVYHNREWLLDAIALARNVQPIWLVLALGTMFTSFLVLSVVFHIVLRVQNRTMNAMRLWATVLVSVVLSQSIPPGGVWSYAFLVSVFKRHHLTTSESTMIATLDMLSYGAAMLSMVIIGMVYMTVHHLTATGGNYVAAGVALAIIVSVLFLLTRSEQKLKNWIWTSNYFLQRITGHTWHNARVHHVVDELHRTRSILFNQPGMVLLLIPIQLLGLCGHSIAMLIILYSLGVTVNFMVVLSSFAIALLTSSFNVLPGGGGTVETALVAILFQFGVGLEAVPAAIIFRLLNFWLLIPIATGCYYWLMHSKPPDDSADRERHEATSSMRNFSLFSD